MANKKVQVQLLDEQTGVVIEDVDVLTTAECVRFADGKTFQDKLNDGSLRGPVGATGLQGPKGDTGAQGQVGTPGSKMHNVTTTPATSLGVIGDWALNTTNGDVYEKTASTTWTKRGNFNGATGPQGPKGDTGTTGSQGPKGDKGDPGDAIKVGTTTSDAVSRKLFFKVVG